MAPGRHWVARHWRRHATSDRRTSCPPTTALAAGMHTCRTQWLCRTAAARSPSARSDSCPAASPMRRRRRRHHLSLPRIRLRMAAGIAGGACTRTAGPLQAAAVLWAWMQSCAGMAWHGRWRPPARRDTSFELRVADGTEHVPRPACPAQPVGYSSGIAGACAAQLVRRRVAAGHGTRPAALHELLMLPGANQRQPRPGN